MLTIDDRSLPAATTDDFQPVAAALVAGLTGAVPAIPALVAQLGEDGPAGLAASWALGQLPAEPAVRAAIATGRIDTRQNGYHALAVLAARGAAAADLGTWLEARIEAEIERTRQTGSGLAEQAAKALAVLGHPRFADLVARIMDADRFCDRYELDRLAQAVRDDGRDRHAVSDLTAPWTTVFADHLAPAPQAAAAEAPAPVDTPPVDEAPLTDLPPEDGLPPAGSPVDWASFNTSPEFAALTPQAQGLIGQLGPMLEQLAQQAVRAPLTDLSAQEFAALLIQVLPQALQPQHVQMALHPYALNGYQALGKFLHRTGASTQGDAIAQGVKVVRTQLQAQMRRSGMLGGPDYSDPDEAKAPA